MRLTTRSEYALIALIYLGRKWRGGFVSVGTIAQAQDIPAKYLEQILLALKRAHCVHSVKGHGGGYKLAKPPDQITLAEVVRLFEGPLAPTASASRYFYESTPIEHERKLVGLFKEIRRFVSDKLEATTIADML